MESKYITTIENSTSGLHVGIAVLSLIMGPKRAPNPAWRQALLHRLAGDTSQVASSTSRHYTYTQVFPPPMMIDPLMRNTRVFH